jgi:hypothetical protein
MRAFKYLTLLLIPVFIFISCESSSEPEEQPALTKEQADALWEANSGLFLAMAGYMESQATSAATFNLGNIPIGFGGGFIGKDLPQSTLLKPAQGEFVFDGVNCWDVVYSYIEGANSLEFEANVCFDVVDQFGVPTDATNTLSLSVDYDLATAYSYDNFSYSLTLTESEVLNLVGIAGFNAETGNLTVNGNQTVNASVIVVESGQTESATVAWTFTLTDIVISPLSDYPLSGTVAFTISVTDNSPGAQNAGYTVSGTITFNGTNTAAVTFAGFDYTLNLDGYYY